jgi:hypothetical protein
MLQSFFVTPPVCRTIYMQVLTTFTIGAFTMTIAFLGAEAAADMSLYPNAEATKPLAVGSMIPSATIRTVTGDSVDLADLVKQTGALLVFYRGGW